MNWKRTVCLLGAVLCCTSWALADEPLTNSAADKVAITKAAIAQQQSQRAESISATADAAAKPQAGQSKPVVELQKRLIAEQAQINLSNQAPLFDDRGAPPNDNCADAIPLSGTVTDLAWSTTYASFDGPGGCMTSNNIWYCWTAEETGQVYVGLCGSLFDTKLAVYNGCDCSNLVQIGCNDDSCGLQSEIYFAAVAGQSYLIEIGGYSTNSGDGWLDIAPVQGQGNDMCADATQLEGTVIDLAFNTSEASFDGPGTCMTSKNIWYCWTAETDGDVYVGLCGSAFDTKLAVYDGCGCSNFVMIGCNDDSCGLQSELNFFAYAGQSYLIEVGGYGSASGGGYLDVIPAGPPLGACCVDNECVATNTQDDCTFLGGEWFINQTCPAFMCPGGCPEDIITINVFTDNYPGETTWTLVDESSGVQIASGGPYATAATLYTHYFCIPYAECYLFTIFDSYGDGICCSYGYGYFEVLLNSELVASGGQFQYQDGPFQVGTACVPPTGACCLNVDCYATNTEAECAALGGAWYIYEECPGFQCPQDPCYGALWNNGGDNLVNGLACENGGQIAPGPWIVDDVTFVADVNITDLHFWTATDDSYGFSGADIIILANASGAPGAVIYEANNLPASRLFLNYYAYGRPVWRNDIVGIDYFLPAGTYWIGMRPHGSTGTGRSFWQTTNENGTGYVYFKGEYWGYYDWTPSASVFGANYNVAFCVTGFMGEPPTGACCNDTTAECQEDVSILDCMGPNFRFLREGACDDLVPPCGEVTGACCYDDGTCEILTQAACTGMWLGAWTNCDMCPCIVPCPPNAVLEQEPCGQDTNGGCNMPNPTFEPISNGVPVCGTIWADGGTRDTDWYQVVVTTNTMFTFTVEGEFDQLGVVCGMVKTTPLGNPDCATATQLDPYATGGECQPISVTTACVPPGTYWFFVSALDFYGLPCGGNNDYVATLTWEPCLILGACCYNEGQNCIDVEQAECLSVYNGDWYFGENCASFVCPTPCPEATINIEIFTDNYPGETTWQVTDYYTGQVLFSGGPYATPGYLYRHQLCVPYGGCYNFTIFDSWGDGICCSYGYGYYNVYFEGTLICTGGQFGLQETCEMFGDNCIYPTGACCIGLDCLYTNYQSECLALGGRWYQGETCPDFVCPDCDVDFCVNAPYYGPTTPMRTTCGAGNDCGLRASEEHEYRVFIPEAGIWTFSLCGSTFDTYLYVGTTRCGQEIGYNDDYCGLQSELSAAVNAGYYYVTVEAYGTTQCGDYVLNVWKQESCEVECPPNGTPEGEPDCYNEYVDATNGGCNSSPYVFGSITCNETICGTSGTYLFGGSNYRDTDWFEIELPAAATLTWEVCASFPANIYILDANQGGCDNIIVAASASAQPYVSASCQYAAAPGTYWLWIGPNVFSGVACGSPFVATLYVDPDVCICGDFDNDGDVDVNDFYFFLDAYGTCIGDIKYEAVCDFDGDQCITLVDYQAWMQCYRNANGRDFVVPKPKLQTGRMGSRPAGQAQQVLP